ncbi:hypothetical protein GA0116948_1334 [Chitinophaga costaii]|uniref:DUF4279 domain-containing protein n=1 Tax=Chitinophaga costaii TaxID=1335309 RepID=A0A1C4G8L3_9BACT|nr:hypothetical protein [Chitinophaga costaii]PUZ23924.1 hypothetical protein DCM91_14145 [Chitinophaga costaii]SCC64512.1 hypothetical protein GA0116948_1334 [Chitinophaga costaii]
MSCFFSLEGKDFDAVKYLQVAPLENAKATLKGEPIATGKRLRERSNVIVTVSEAAFTDLDRQIKDTISFLKNNRNQLSFVQNFPGIDYATVVFGVYLDTPLFMKKLNKTFEFPAELISIAGELGIGIDIALYPE